MAKATRKGELYYCMDCKEPDTRDNKNKKRCFQCGKDLKAKWYQDRKLNKGYYVKKGKTLKIK